MSAYNSTLKDSDGNYLYPKTLEENVYDSNNNRLDQKIEGIESDIAIKQGTLKFKNITIGDVTVSASGYVNISNRINAACTSAGIDPSKLIMVTVADWTNMSVISAVSVYGWKNGVMSAANNVITGMIMSACYTD